MSFNKIFILGAGAIGSAFGALLSRRNDVTLIGRKDHVDVINKSGLTLLGDAKGKFFIEAEAAIREIPSDSLILLNTKAYDTVSAVTGIRSILRNDTVILVLPNGLGIKDIAQKVVEDRAEVVRGLVTSAAEFFELGKISFWQGETVLESTQTSERIARVLSESGLKTVISNEMQEEIWKKLIVNCVLNPLTTILQVRNNEILLDSLKEIRNEIIRECVDVGKAEGTRFEQNLEECVERKIARYTNYSSMYQDIMKQKKTEIDFLNGKIVELGRKHNIPTPVNEALVGLIKFLEAQRK
ncbi:MAG: 2-dehydropantoate 2-reductase [Candidatus Bathyarchaeota archaeon]|nr:2-dehydropantoate 2-reductase [Candidatus Bathyarchaeota archaeon]